MQDFVNAVLSDPKVLFSGLGIFVLGLVVAFLAWLFRDRSDPAAGTASAVSALTVRLESILKEGFEKDQQIKGLKEAVEALSQTQAPGVETALAQLRDGNTEDAEAIFQDILSAKKAEGEAAYKDPAAAARHIGALAFLHDTEKALAMYRQVVNLDPDDADGWNQLGNCFSV